MKLVDEMSNHDPIKNFEALWETFNNRYPFFALRQVDWQKQYELFRPRVSAATSNDELFDIFSQMLDPLNDGHVELEARFGRPKKKRTFTAEKPTRFHQEFPGRDLERLFKVTEDTLAAAGFGRLQKTPAWMLRYCRSASFGYLRVLELEDVKKKKLAKALDQIARDFEDLKGFIIDIRDNPGGEDSIALAIINRFADQRRVAFHRRTKIGPGADDFKPLKTWYIEPQGDKQFTGPIVMLTCDAVFSGGESFALALRELPHVTVLGEPTNGIFSYTFDQTLPNGWDYCLSYQEYLSAGMVCYEGQGVPVDIELSNTRADLESGKDSLIVRALEILQEKAGAVAV